MNCLSSVEIEELQKSEEDLWKTETRFDESYMRKLMSPDFIEYGRSGKIYNIEEVLSIEPRGAKITLPLPEFKVRLDFPAFARHQIALKCNSMRGVYERQTVYRRIQERSS